jgi:hypothetical protein
MTGPNKRGVRAADQYPAGATCNGVALTFRSSRHGLRPRALGDPSFRRGPGAGRTRWAVAVTG